MTLTAEEIARYEERAAKGETPRLPWHCYPDRDWLVSWMAVIGTACRIYQRDGGAGFHAVFSTSDDTRLLVGVDVSSHFADGHFDSIIAAQLFLEDRLRAFAAPLLDAPVEGPWVCAEIGGRVLVGLKPDDTCIYDHVAWDYALKFDRWSEAEAIARVRNQAWQRRQKENGDG